MKEKQETSIDNKELILALEDLEKEKGMNKDYILDSIETALVTAYKRNFDSLENVKVVMERKTGATHIYSVRQIVKKVENPEIEISLKVPLMNSKIGKRSTKLLEYTEL